MRVWASVFTLALVVLLGASVVVAAATDNSSNSSLVSGGNNATSASQSGTASHSGSAASTYGDMSSAAASIPVNSSFYIGGTSWIRVYANGAAWAALWDALRSDIATAIGVPMADISLYSVIASGYGLSVNYTVQAASPSSASELAAKAAALAAGGTSLPATALVYQAVDNPVVADPVKYIPSALSESSVYLAGRSSDAFTSFLHFVVVWSSVAALVVGTAFVM